MLTVGISLEPEICRLVTNNSLKSTFRYGLLSAPDLIALIVPVLMCVPAQMDLKNLGVDLSKLAIMLKSDRSALPAPEPPEPETEETWEAPQLQLKICISFS